MERDPGHEKTSFTKIISQGKYLKKGQQTSEECMRRSVAKRHIMSRFCNKGHTKPGNLKTCQSSPCPVPRDHNHPISRLEKGHVTYCQPISAHQFTRCNHTLPEPHSRGVCLVETSVYWYCLSGLFTRLNI